MLLDIRHTPSSKDIEMLNFLVFYNIPIIFVLTKLDKIKKSEVEKNKIMISSALKTGKENLIVISNETGVGRKEIEAKILQIMAK